MPSLSPTALASLFSLSPSSPQITAFLETLASPSPLPQPEIKSYPDAIYHNYYALGLSLCFLPNKGLDSVDIFNTPSSSSSSAPPPPPPRNRFRREEPTYSPPPEIELHFPTTTLVVPPAKEGDEATELPRPEKVVLKPNTIGRQLVSCLGEPSRKGSGGWTGLWLEWTKVELKRRSEEGEGEGVVEVGLMVELRDPGAAEKMTEEDMRKGMGGVWDRAAKWEWKSLKVFKPE
ncbi:hypothetical protein CI109_101275 [Kwoniella shandongensis]|uniref:Uncharacterized protein n=1 Tax=Kwoniella shandongensis TaxID=1734106 RepID=A0A5M6BQP9_9TREE|nr:uncharacterized protein CI109_007223 [Kwoniella shandongensis]KAA5524431.1 hypothetical protein CI109_007223 [Kwoniella shandongensis]